MLSLSPAELWAWAGTAGHETRLSREEAPAALGGQEAGAEALGAAEGWGAQIPAEGRCQVTAVGGGVRPSLQAW